MPQADEPPRPLLYLGSTGRDLYLHREAVRRAILGMERFEIRSIEDLPSSEDFYASWLAECDVFVGLYGDEPGATNASGDTLFIERELDAALNLDLDVLLYLPIGPTGRIPPGFDARVPTLLTAVFEGIPDLVEQVVSALRRWLDARKSPSTDSPSSDVDGLEGPPDRERPRHEGVLSATVGDRAVAVDALGFAPYVRAIARFLEHERTRPPLTLSIEGRWGSGKTSFMLQLRDRLIADAERSGDQPPLVVWFNAWRHDRAEALWASFAVEFTRQVARALPFHRRWWGHLKLLGRRFAWRRGLPQLLRFVLFWILVGGAAVALPILAASSGTTWVDGLARSLGPDKEWEAAFGWTAWVGGTLGYALLLLTAWVRLKSFLGDPIAFDLREHLDTPDYQGSVSFVESFHADFRKVVEAYAGERTVYVFVDDLDRCSVPKAADLIEGLNLMMSDDMMLVFILGMDREKVAAGLAVKHEKLLPYLYGAPPTGDAGREAQILRLRGLEFGYEFIEKFIQLPFTVPRADGDELKRYIDTLSPGSDSVRTVPRSENQEASSTAAPTTRAGPAPSTSRESPEAPAAVLARRELVITRANEDSERLRQITLAVAPAFHHNPRRIKQFVNLFRLRTFLAAETGLFDAPPDGLPMTLEQFGKFVAMSLAFPLLLEDLEQERTLLPTLQEKAITGELALPSDSPAVVRWSDRRALLDLLRIGVRATSEAELRSVGADRWALSALDVEHLLRVSPQVASIEDLVEEDRADSAESTDLRWRQSPPFPFRDPPAS